MTTELSIVIPTSNSMKGKKNSLQLVLFSISKQTINKKNIEIVFVDNNSKDDTLDFIEEWISCNKETYGSLHLLRNRDFFNRSKSRNMGVEKSGAEKILFIDDDTVMYENHTLELIAESYYQAKTFFCGAQRYWTIAGWEYERVKQSINEQSPVYRIAFLPRGISRETGYRDLQEYTFIGNFGGMLKKDFIETGGFDAKRFPDRQEDVELMFRLLLNGYKFQQAEVNVIHLNHPIIANGAENRMHWLKEFRKKELEEGYYFCINHLFGVYEDYTNNYPVLKSIDD